MAALVQTVRMATVERASGSVLREMISGFAFVKGNNIYIYLIGMTYVVTCLGTSYIFLMPVFAEEVLAVGSEGMGWLIATSGIGGLIGIFAFSAFGKVRWRGWAILGSAVGYGIFLICFALSSWFWLSLIAVFCAGLCVFFYLPTLMATIHSLVPNEYRGRVMGLYVTSFNLMPLGALQAGFLSSYFNPQFAVAFGGSPGSAIRFGAGPWSRTAALRW
jgi:predicted MFS family arabinose efflux permease